ncbi:MAG: family 20 glycosylhydrolase [Bacteroidaceae bacterium]
MKRTRLATFCFLISSITYAENVVTDNFTKLSASQKASATHVVLTGALTTTGNSDFRQLRDLARQLSSMDLQKSKSTEIPNNAFFSHPTLKTVVLPKKVQRIGTSAFFACKKLSGTIVFPSSLEEIGSVAFSGCQNLETLRFENAVKLGSYAFRGCQSLRQITIESSIPPVTETAPFYGVNCKRCVLLVPTGAAKSYRQNNVWGQFTIKEDKSLKANARAVKIEAATLLKSSAINLIPTPQKQEATGETLIWNTVGRIVAPASLENEMIYAKEMLRTRANVKVGKVKKTANATIHLSLDHSLVNDESYTLNLNEKGVEIKGKTAAGVFWGLTTLEQLMVGNGENPRCTQTAGIKIEDTPRTPIRELMIDPARMFIPFEELKALVPEMARYKLNSLHLHLSDDQAWCMEIKAYPKLTEIGSKRIGMDDRRYPIEGFYTQDQMRELVAYAAKYHVMVIPEIEMPGHSVAAIHCYPWLTCGEKQMPIRTITGVSNELLCPSEERVYEFLGTVFREISAIFPAPYFHIGGDEAGHPALGCWTNCTKCVALRQEKGFTANWQLQEYMFGRMIDTLHTLGKTPMFWYETDFKKIPKGCVTFAWRHGLTQAAIKAAMANDAKIMLCPGEHCYFDYPERAGDMPEVNWGMPITSLQQAYKFDPGWGNGEDFEKNYLFGVAGTIWGESLDSPERISYMAYPRALALAEAGWSKPENRSWNGFLSRLVPLLRDMQRRGVPFRLPTEYIEMK